MNSASSEAKIDLVVVTAIAVIVYFLCCFAHEGLGHGGMAVLHGVDVDKITNAYCRTSGYSQYQARWIAAGGSMANLLLAAVAILARRKLPKSNNDTLHYFLWLLAMMNLFSCAGYMMSFAFLKVGDINIIVRGLPYEIAIRTIICLVGVAMVLGVMFYAGGTLREFAGGGEDRVRRGVTLTLVPYLAGGVVNVGASLLGVGEVPLAIVLMSSIGATFGGNFPLLWTPLMMGKPDTNAAVLTPTRGNGWLIAGAVCFVLYLILGHGITFT